MNKLITFFVIWWCEKQLKKIQRTEGNHKTIFYINGTGKDKNKYLLFTNLERVKIDIKEKIWGYSK